MKNLPFFTPEDYQACLQSIAEAGNCSVELILTYTVNLPEHTDKISFLQALQKDFNNGTLKYLIERISLLEVNPTDNRYQFSEFEVVERQLNDLKTFFQTFAPVLIAEYRNFLETQRLEERELLAA